MKRIGQVSWIIASQGVLLVVLQAAVVAPPAQFGRQSIAIEESMSGNASSRFGKLTSSQWAYGNTWTRQNLRPVANPNPSPEPRPTRSRPFDVALSSDGRKVYVGLLGSEKEPGSEVAVYDFANDRMLKRILLKPEGIAGAAGSGPYRLALHPGGRFLVVTNRFSNFASVIDTQTDKVVSEIPLDFYCQGITFAPDGKMAWVANRYLDEVFVIDIETAGGAFTAKMRISGGLDDQAFFAANGIGHRLQQSCGTTGCHDVLRGGFAAGIDLKASFVSVLDQVVPGQSRQSRLLRAVTRSRDGGYADAMPLFRSHAGKTVVFGDPKNDGGYQAIAAWIDSAQEGPGIPVGNPRSKPKTVAASTDGRFIFVGNTGTQDISIVSTKSGQEVGAIYVQNVVNDLKIHRSSVTGHDWLVVTTMGIGFGVARERDPWGGETWDKANPAAQYTVKRNLATAEVLPKSEQEILGPFDAVDGTAGIKFRDIQNDLVAIDVDAMAIPEQPPAAGLSHLLKVNRYESHRGWVRYTSDTAESMYGDVKGDIPPDLMRVVGSLPERMALVGDRVFITMQGTNEVQEMRINPDAADPSDILSPVRNYPTGMQPFGIVAGQLGTVAEGKLFVANFLSGTLSVIDTTVASTREVVVDPSILKLPMPATDAERGEVLVHSALFSSDRDSSCVSCHYLELNDGRPWGVSQVVGQEYLADQDRIGQLIEGTTMMVPQQKSLWGIQPFFFEGTLSVYDPRSMLMEHCPADDFRGTTPDGDYRWLEAHTPIRLVADVQSKMNSATTGDAGIEERRAEFFRRTSLRIFGKAFVLRDFQRFVGEWQANEPRLMPVPFDLDNASIRRGRALFNEAQVGCVSCHPAPHFAKKNLPNNPRQVIQPQVSLSTRDGSFTLISMERLDMIAGIRRDLEPWDIGRAEDEEAHFTPFQLRGLWDRPPVFLHNGAARTLREVVSVPGQTSLGWFKYEPLFGGYGERPGRREVGFNETYFIKKRTEKTKTHLDTGGRIGSDTHGGTSQLTAQQIDDLVNYLQSIE
jgi:YVTN family beta-propeller protein